MIDYSKSDVFNVISVLKAMAIAMVVCLHFEYSYGNKLEGYQTINNILRPLRMPAFMFVSGFLYFYISKTKYRTYTKFVYEKFKRLIIPMLTLKLSFVAIKQLMLPIALRNYIYANNTFTEFNWSSFLDGLLVNPSNDTNSVHLWFVYALFIIFAISHLFRNNIYILTAISIAFYFVKVPQIFELDSVRVYLPFFCMGAILQLHLNTLIKFVEYVRVESLFVTGFILSAILCFNGSEPESVSLNSLCRNVAGVIVMLSTAVIITSSKSIVYRLLHWVGSYSVVIYFFHNNFIRIYDIIIRHIHIAQSVAMLGWLSLITGIIFAILGTITLDKYIISRSDLLGFMLLGRKSPAQDDLFLKIVRTPRHKIQSLLHIRQGA